MSIQPAEIETRLQHRGIADQTRENIIADFMRFGVDRLRAMHYFDVVFPWVVGAYVAGQSEADLRARISALADEFDDDQQGCCGMQFPCTRHEGAPIKADDLRSLLDRPAAEGDN